MYASLLAEVAAQRQSELLREAETRRLRHGALRRPETTRDSATVSALARWRRAFITMMRPAPEPCCA